MSTSSVLSALVALAPGAIGPAVANLHAVLARFALAGDIPIDETMVDRFGPGTVRAVDALFQKVGFGANPSGVIDDTAAQKLNEYLAEQHILAVAFGKVVDATGAAAIGYVVRLHDAQNLDGAAAAETTVSKNTSYFAFYDPQFYAQARPGVVQRTDAIAVVIRAYDLKGAEAARSNPTANPSGRVQIADLTIPGTGEPPPAQDGGLRVHGWLEDSAGRRLPGYRLTVYDRDLGDPRKDGQRVGTTENGVDADGAFDFHYKLGDFSKGDSPPPVADLILVLEDPNGGALDRFDVYRQPVDGDNTITTELPVPADDLPLGIVARPNELLRIVLLDVPTVPDRSEYADLLAALSPLLGARTPADMNEETYRDVSFAAREVARDPAKIADLVLAFQLVRDALHDIDPAPVYALARTLGIRDVRALAAQSADNLIQALQAASPLLIPDLGADVKGLVIKLRGLATAAALALPLTVASASLKDLLAKDLPDPAQQAALVQAFSDHTGDAPSFWEAYSAANPAVPVLSLQLSLQLGGATAHNAKLVDAIRAALPDAPNLRTLALDLDAAKVSELIVKSGASVPDVQPGETPDAARERYAAGVAGVLEAAHPTATVARLARSWTQTSPQMVDSAAVQLLDRVVRNSDYEIGTGGLEELAAAKSDVLFAGVADPVAKTRAVQDALRLERLYTISPSPATLALLATRASMTKLPFQGAFDVARYGKEAFLSHFADQPMEVQSAVAAAHDTASSMAEASASLLLALHQEAADPQLAAVTPQTSDNIPSWAKLFGTDRLTACDDCQSLGGPAAYLVNVFEFLDKRCPPNAAGVTPLDVLIGNAAKGVPGLRPDLAFIKLSCENTNTAIPAIDLINEILESAIVFNSTLPNTPNESSPGVTADELAAAPEHVLAKAYDTLAGAFYPPSLPFERTTATARVYLSEVKSSREEIVQLFHQGVDVPSAVAAERLRLATRDWEILTGKTLAGANANSLPTTAELYGFLPADAGWMAKLAIVSEAAARLEVTVGDLIKIVSTEFISGKWPVAERAVLERMPLDTSVFKAIRDAGFAGSPVDVAALLEWVNLKEGDLKAWSERNANLLARTVVLDPPTATKLDGMSLVHLDASSLSDSDWRRLHCFVRLLKRAGADIDELDRALSAASTSGAIDVATLSALGDLAGLKASLSLDWASTTAFVADIDTRGLDSSYAKLFLRSGVATTDKLFAPLADGTVLPIQPEPQPAIVDHSKALAAAYGCSEADILAVAIHRGISAVTLADISAIYRQVRLAQGLGITVADSLLLQRMSGPGVVSGSGELLQPLEFVSTARSAVSDGGALDAMAFFCGDESGARVGLGAAAIDKILKQVRDGLASLDAAAKVAVSQSGQPPVTPGTTGPNSDSERRRTARDILAAAFGTSPDLITVALEDQQLPASGAADPSPPPKPRKAILRTPQSAPPNADAVEGMGALLNAGDDGAALAVLNRLERVAVLVKALGLKPEVLLVLAATKGALGPEVLAALAGAGDPVLLRQAWASAQTFQRLAKGRDATAIASALAALAAPDGPTWTDDAATAVGRLRPARNGETKDAAESAVKQVTADAKNLLGILETSWAPRILRDDPIGALADLQKRLDVCARTGVPADSFVTLSGGAGSSESALDALIKGVQGRYDAVSWLGVARRLNDPLRQQRRDALVAYLKQSVGLPNDEAVFNRLLIDPQLNPPIPKSRISCAIEAVQYYVLGVKLGKQLGKQNGVAIDAKFQVAPNQINPEWDLFLHSSAMAQANFEVLSDPYLYMTTELRDDKTPLFKDVEAFFRQNDVTPDNITQAYLRFTEGVAEISNLEICGTFLQEEFEGDEAFRFKSVLHVFGRSRGGVRRTYYYRRLNRYTSFDEWSPWEPVKVDIAAVERDRSTTRTANDTDKPEAGVHLLPVLWQRRLYIFWPSFVRKIESSSASPTMAFTGKGATTNAVPPDPYWEVKLCWSQFDHGVWSPRQMSSDYFDTYETTTIVSSPNTKQGFAAGFKTVLVRTPVCPPLHELVLKANVSGANLSIDLLHQPSGESPTGWATYAFDAIRGDIVVSTTSGIFSGDHPVWLSTSRRFMSLVGQGALTAKTSEELPKGVAILRTAPSYIVTTLNQHYTKQLAAPFFLADAERSYFVDAKASTMTVERTVGTPPAALLSLIPRAASNLAVIATLAGSRASDPKPWVRSINRAILLSSGPTLQSSPEPRATAFAEPNPAAKITNELAALEHSPYIVIGQQPVSVPTLSVTFTPFFHPFADEFVVKIRKYGLDRIFSEDVQGSSLKDNQPFFQRYSPDPARVTNDKLVEAVDFGAGTPYGVYNNELFFYLPDLLRSLLAQNNRFSEALAWAARYFDVLGADTDPASSWKFLPFRQADSSLGFAELLNSLQAPPDDLNRKAALAQIEASQLYPFQPFRIARLRPDAMKKYAFMQVLKTHLAYGDERFTLYTPESVMTEALPHYLIADAMLGPKLETLPAPYRVAKSYAELRPHLDAMGNAVLTVETKLGALATISAPVTASGGQAATLRLAATGYFCLPTNQKLLDMWDTVADRLFKIRNGYTIDGVRRPLPLVGPKIDPSVLVAAAAAGRDLNAAADAALGGERPIHKFPVSLRRTYQLIERLIDINRSLGSTFEKRDAEHLAYMRTFHEGEILGFIGLAKQAQIDEAAQSLAALLSQREIAMVRWRNYRQQLGFDDLPEPQTDLVSGIVLQTGQRAPQREFKLVDGASIDLPPMPQDPTGTISIPTALSLQRGKILSQEREEVVTAFGAAQANVASSALHAVAAVVTAVPNIETAAKPYGLGAGIHFGGMTLGRITAALAHGVAAVGTSLGFVSTNAGRQAAFLWRERDFANQLNIAAAEALHVDQTMMVVLKGIDSRTREKTTSDEQAKRNQIVLNYLSSKFTSEDFHQATITGLMELQKKAFAAALDLIQMPRQNFAFDWRKDPPPVRGDLWTIGPNGLLSGEALYLAAPELESAYMAESERRQEITRHFSLKQVNPFALFRLRETGSCDFTLDEALFDLDCPGMYARRLQSVQITIPCVSGPYTPVSATLTLKSSWIRDAAVATAAGYARSGSYDSDPKFKRIDLPTSCSVITTSSAREDGGLFQPPLPDDRYGPFEGAGAICDLNLTMPDLFRQLDYRTISDVVLRVQYIAKRDETLINVAQETLKSEFDALTKDGARSGLYLLQSARHDFPDDWYQHTAATDGSKLQLVISRDRLPYAFRKFASAKVAPGEPFAVWAPAGTPASIDLAKPILVTVQDPDNWTLTVDAPDDPTVAQDDVYIFFKYAIS